MWINKRHALILIFCLGGQILTAQDDSAWDIEFNGYLKTLNSVITSPLFGDDYLLDHLIHNRLNTRIEYKSNWSLSFSARNRLFYGDLVKSFPDYDMLVESANNDWLDLSIMWIKKDNLVLNTNFDRLYLEYVKGDWEARIGRQRINWGINLLWNPNDLFNTFDFTDFDYEERPGSDAVWLKKYTGFASSWEFAFKAADHIDEVITAFMWRGHKGNYDYQVLVGKYLTDIAIGGGWAGNIKDAGFKGEFTLFVPYDDQGDVEASISMGIDYAFEKGWYTSAGIMYNSTGTAGGNFGEVFIGQVTPKSLYPFTYAIFNNTTYQVSPLINAFLTFVYSPVEVHPLFLSPGVTYSIATNWDLDLIGQVSWIKEDGDYGSGGNFYYMRVK